MPVVDRQILWVTNLAAPYRLPMWRHMATSRPLRVELLENSSRLARDIDANRGADWMTSNDSFPIIEATTVRLRRGEARYYASVDPRDISRVRRAHTVVLGGWESPAYWQILALARISKKPTVGFYESTLLSQGHADGPVARARAQFFRTLDRVVVPGPAARDAILSMGVPVERISMGFNAVAVDAFGAVRHTPKAWAGHRFIYVGQLIERKRVDVLLRSFANIAQPEDELHIVGRGPLDAELHHMARDLGVAARVRWTDYVPNAELPRTMATADTLVLPSSEEVWGLVANEALAAGLQCVVTRSCGVAPSIEGMVGVQVADTTDDLANAMSIARSTYSGPIREPEILQYTPARFGDVFLQAADEADSHRMQRNS